MCIYVGQEHLCNFKAATVTLSAFVHLCLEGVAPFYDDVTNDDITKMESGIIRLKPF